MLVFNKLTKYIITTGFINNPNVSPLSRINFVIPYKYIYKYCNSLKFHPTFSIIYTCGTNRTVIHHIIYGQYKISYNQIIEVFRLCNSIIKTAADTSKLNFDKYILK